MSESFAHYMPHIRQRLLRERQGWQARREKAWDYARHAAAVLRAHGAQEVIAFGSLVTTGIYDERSDIDLIVTQLPEQKFFTRLGGCGERRWRI